MLEKGESNTYHFHGEVVEVIRSGGTPSIKLVCNPGSLIIQIPYEEDIRLGDRYLAIGRLKLMSTEKLPASYE